MEMSIPGFRSVPKTGVIYVMSEAAKYGFSYDDSAWANLGQGSPETGPIPDAPPRITNLTIDPTSHRYSDIQGNLDLRQKVADYYNQMYRRGKKFQYTYENVSIAGGGRIALTRLAAALGNINMGHFLPDYTAYEELLSVFRAFVPIPILLDYESDYRITSAALRKEILGRGLRALLLSNPCNPTGQVVDGRELKALIDLASEAQCTFIIDEFYSHYIYSRAANQSYRMISAAEYIEDINESAVVIVDGLTKNWRYPGWRISWTLAPKSVIELIASAGSFLDGGANSPFQKQAIALLEPDIAIQETIAIQNHFTRKRDLMLDRLQGMGIAVEDAPQGTFYVWANLSKLPAPLNDGLSFFEEGLKENVITVPGMFFDVNPDRRRSLRRYQNYCRISFGGEIEKLELGLASIERLIKKFS